MVGNLIEQGVSQSDVCGGLLAEPVNMPSSIENPNFNLDDPDAYDLLTGGAMTPSGVRVSHESALMHPAVWQAVTMISGDVAGLPLEVFRVMPDGDRVKQESDQLYEVAHWQSNREMNAFRFWRRMIAWKLLWGNSYAMIGRSGSGLVNELIPLLPDRTAPERVNGRLYVVTEVEGNLVPIVAEDVFHLEGISIDTLAGYDFIKAARMAIGLALSEMGFASRFFSNGGRVGGILELPAAMPKTARDKVEEGFRKTYGSSEAFKTIVLRENAKFHQAQVTPEAAQVVDARQESVRDIARLFNVRPGKLGEESRTSFASKSEDNRDYYDTTLRPHLRDITQECRSKLLTRSEKGSGYYFEHDTRTLLMMDFKSMSDSLVKLRGGEIINSDEARRMLNMNKRGDGRGGEYQNPNINPTTSSSEGGEEDPVTEPTAKAFRMLLSSTIQRMAGIVSGRAKRKASDPKLFLQWIDEKYSDQEESIRDAVSEVVVAASGVLDIDSQALCNEIVEGFVDESRSILQTIASSTPADELKKVVEANLTEWAAEAGQRYASLAFDNTSPSRGNSDE